MDKRILDILSYLNYYCNTTEVEYIIYLMSLILKGDIILDESTCSSILDEIHNTKYFVTDNYYHNIIPIFEGIVNDIRNNKHSYNR